MRPARETVNLEAIQSARAMRALCREVRGGIFWPSRTNARKSKAQENGNNDTFSMDFDFTDGNAIAVRRFPASSDRGRGSRIRTALRHLPRKSPERRGSARVLSLWKLTPEAVYAALAKDRIRACPGVRTMTSARSRPILAAARLTLSKSRMPSSCPTSARAILRSPICRVNPPGMAGEMA